MRGTDRNTSAVSAKTCHRVSGCTIRKGITMTLDQITKANAEIARICGWADVRIGKLDHSRLYGLHPNPEVGRTQIPNYFESYEACAEMRKCLTAYNQIQFNAELYRVIFGENKSPSWPTFHIESHFIYDLINAAPTPQAMAFLGVKGKG